MISSKTRNEGDVSGKGKGGLTPCWLSPSRYFLIATTEGASVLFNFGQFTKKGSRPVDTSDIGQIESPCPANHQAYVVFSVRGPVLAAKGDIRAKVPPPATLRADRRKGGEKAC